MIIRLLKQEAIDQRLIEVKNDFQKHKKFYTEHSVIDYDFESPFKDIDYLSGDGYQVDDKYFDQTTNQMMLDPDSNSLFENVKTFYTAFKDLTPFQASQGELWIGLTHGYCHRYSVNRWNITEKTFEDRLFFNGRGRRARMHNAIARLWWIGHLTLDGNASSEDEKWRFTKEVCSSQDYITSIFERQIGSYGSLREGLLTYFIENDLPSGTNKSVHIQNILRDLNNYGGVQLLSMLDSKEVTSIVKEIALDNYGG